MSAAPAPAVPPLGKYLASSGVLKERDLLFFADFLQKRKHGTKP
jgi:hypothetical protein